MVSDGLFHAPREALSLAGSESTGWRSCPPNLPLPEDRYGSLAALPRGPMRGKAVTETSREMPSTPVKRNSRVHGSPLEQRNAHRQLLEWKHAVRCSSKTCRPLRGGQLAGVLERDPVHLLGGLVEEDDRSPRRRARTIGTERFAATPLARMSARLFCGLVIVATTHLEGTEAGPRGTRASLLTWLTTCLRTAVSADSLTVANRLRPVLLQLARELRREVHPLGVTGGQVSLLVSIRAFSRHRCSRARCTRGRLAGRDVAARHTTRPRRPRTPTRPAQAATDAGSGSS